MKNFNHFEQIKADAFKLTTRRLKEAEEDGGFVPTGPLDFLESNTMGDADKVEAKKTEPSPEDEPAEDVSQSEDRSLNDLRKEAKELGLPAGGSKEELTQRIEAKKAEDAEGKEQE